MIFPIGSRWAQKLSCFDNSVWSEKTWACGRRNPRGRRAMSKTPVLTKGEAITLMSPGPRRARKFFGNAEGDVGDLQQNVRKASFHVACSLR